MNSTAHRLNHQEAPSDNSWGDRLLFVAVALLLLAPLFYSGEKRTVEVAAHDAPALVAAAESGDMERIDALLAHGTPVDDCDICRWTPLMKAALNGHTEAARTLLNAGADVRRGDQGAYTALLLAASNGHREIVALLLDHGADINHRETTQGFSALIWAAQRGHPDTVRLLLARGADPALRDNGGRTALAWAEAENRPEIAALLAPATDGLYSSQPEKPAGT